MDNEHLDVLIVGAGLSGIAAGYHLQNESPDRTYAILERREATQRLRASVASRFLKQLLHATRIADARGVRETSGCA